MKYFWKTLNILEVVLFSLFTFYYVITFFVRIENYIHIPNNLILKYAGMFFGIILIYGAFSELIILPLALIVFLLGYKYQKKGTYKYLVLYFVFFIIKISIWFTIMLLGVGGDHRHSF